MYFIVGVALGLYMAATQDHTMHPVHAHLNLLGWVSLGLFGLFYRVVPAAATTRLAQAHFVQMVTLFALFLGYPGVEPLLGVVSFVVGAGVLCFAAVVWRNTAEAGEALRETLMPAGVHR